MKRVATFEKVSIEQFVSAAVSYLGVTESAARDIYDEISLPRRATSGSAGYDFYLPTDLHLLPGDSVLIPTGIRCRIDEGWVLMLFPRSGLGFKYRLQLNNTVGVIDSDYYNSSNEGHIMAKLTNCSQTSVFEGKTLDLDAGKGFIQGILMPFGFTTDDDADGVRDGGFGSTSK